MNTQASRWILALSFALAAAGFLLPLWPLTLLGIALAALSGRWLSAIIIGLLLDIAYGAPAGRWHFLYFPFTIFALAAALARYYLAAYIRKSSRNTLRKVFGILQPCLGALSGGAKNKVGDTSR